MRRNYRTGDILDQAEVSTEKRGRFQGAGPNGKAVGERAGKSHALLGTIHRQRASASITLKKNGHRSTQLALLCHQTTSREKNSAFALAVKH